MKTKFVVCSILDNTAPISLMFNFFFVIEIKSALKNDSKKIADLQHEISDIESTLEKKKRLEVEANERIAKLQMSLNEETSLRISLENNMREIDARHRRTIHQIREEKDQELKEKEALLGQIKAENESLVNQLRELNVKSDYKKDSEVKDKPTIDVHSKMNGSLQSKSASFVPGN
jgi:chromosome segregation ATPase